MKAAVLLEPEKLLVKDVDVPEIGPSEVLLRVKAAALCGTDIHVYSGGLPARYPIIMGHEYAGIVEEVGEEVADFKVGDRVFGAPSVADGKCHYCKKGQENLCENVKVFGLHVDGAFAEYFRGYPNALYRLPDAISFMEGCIIGDTCATTVHALRRLNVKAGEFVVVFGDGPIGLFACQVAKAFGAIVALVGIVPDRLSFAKGVLNVDYTINSKEVNPVAKINELTDKAGADVAVEAVGIPITLEQAIMSISRGGKVLAIGIYETKPQVYMTHIVYREKSIIGSFAHVRGDIEYSLNLISSGKVRLKQFITKTLPLEKISEGISLFKQRKAIKIVLTT